MLRALLCAILWIGGAIATAQSNAPPLDDYRFVPSKIDQQGRLILREHVGGENGIKAYQVFNLERDGQAYRRVVPCALDDIILEVTLALEGVVAVDREGKAVDRQTLEAALRKEWTPVVVCHADPYAGPVKTGSPMSPFPARLKCLTRGTIILTVPYPLIGAENTKILDLASSFPPPPDFAFAVAFSRKTEKVVGTAPMIDVQTQDMEEEFTFRVRGTGEHVVKTFREKRETPTTVEKKFYVDAEVFDTDKGPMDPDEIGGLLGKGRAVLWVREGNPLHSFYLHAVRECTLVFVVQKPTKSEPNADVQDQQEAGPQTAPEPAGSDLPEPTAPSA